MRRETTITLSVVIPVHNEEGCVEELHSELRDALDRIGYSWEIVFVDDGSTDDTPHRLSKLRSGDSRVRTARFPTNRGQSAALAEGFRLCRGKTIVSMDGDLQFNPNEISALLQALESTDVVCGWRRPRQDEWHRRLLSFLAYLAQYGVLGERVHDPGCTFRAYRRRCVGKLALQPGHHRFLPYLLRMKGHRVSEIPVSHRKRKYGQSKYGLLRLAKGLATLLSLRLGTIGSPRQ